MEQDQSNQPSSLTTTVLRRIECGECTLRPKYYFTGREWLVWSVWVLTVLIGAIAVALIMLRLMYGYYALYEATHGTWYAFWLSNLPYLWLLVFSLLAVVTLFEVRETKRGYRVAWWVVLGSSVSASFVGGVLIHAFNLSHAIDHDLGEMTAYYDSTTERENRYWHQPMAGRLVGTPESVPVEVETTRGLMAHVRDRENVLWAVEMADLSTHEQEILTSASLVRVYGEVVSTEPPRFHACGAYPWHHDRESSMTELEEVKTRFREQWYHYRGNEESVCARVWQRKRTVEGN